MKWIAISICLLAVSCGRVQFAPSDAVPEIFPDYVEVTVPETMKALNFAMADGREVSFRSERVGDTLFYYVKAWEKGSRKGIAYAPFKVFISKDEIPPYIAYRLIEPNYEGWRDMGIYSRELATYQDHGQSFLVLRRLLADYYQTGNYVLAEKYAAVLSRSTLHSQYVDYFMDRMATGTPREPDSIAFRKNVPLITRDPLSNLILLGAGGINAPSSVDRVLCSLLLQCDLENFQAVFDSVRERYQPIPRYYEEALVMAGQTEGISARTMQRFAEFQTETMLQSEAQLRQHYGDTFWLFMREAL